MLPWLPSEPVLVSGSAFFLAKLVVQPLNFTASTRVDVAAEPRPMLTRMIDDSVRLRRCDGLETHAGEVLRAVDVLGAPALTILKVGMDGAFSGVRCGDARNPHEGGEAGGVGELSAGGSAQTQLERRLRRCRRSAKPISVSRMSASATPPAE